MVAAETNHELQWCVAKFDHYDSQLFPALVTILAACSAADTYHCLLTATDSSFK
jgi:hypothetical protein